MVQEQGLVSLASQANRPTWAVRESRQDPTPWLVPAASVGGAANLRESPSRRTTAKRGSSPGCATVEMGRRRGPEPAARLGRGGDGTGEVQYLGTCRYRRLVRAGVLVDPLPAPPAEHDRLLGRRRVEGRGRSRSTAPRRSTIGKFRPPAPAHASSRLAPFRDIRPVSGGLGIPWPPRKRRAFW